MPSPAHLQLLSAFANSPPHEKGGPSESPADPPIPLWPLRDPDSVVLCLLAIDEEEEDDIALQIHFTLIQSFCCDNDIDIVRVSGMQRLAQLLGEPAETQGTTEARDLHCLLVTVSKLGLRPAPPPPGTWACVCQQSGAGRCAPAQRSATLGMSRGQPAGLQASSPSELF